MQPNLDRIIDLAEQVSAPLGLSVVEARISQQGKQRSLEVTIYRRGGRIALADCEQVSRQLEELLDGQSPPLIDGSFLLEVQSPGIDRKLKSDREFQVFAGLPVEVKTKEKIGELGFELKGKLVGMDKGKVVLAQPAILKNGQSKAQNKKAGKKQTQAAVTAASTLETLEIEIEKVIHVRLMPEEPKAESEMTPLDI
jgi:ribosome maturation factor RimP